MQRKLNFFTKRWTTNFNSVNWKSSCCTNYPSENSSHSTILGIAHFIWKIPQTQRFIEEKRHFIDDF